MGIYSQVALDHYGHKGLMKIQPINSPVIMAIQPINSPVIMAIKDVAYNPVAVILNCR
jgi:hypothetical protein